MAKEPQIQFTISHPLHNAIEQNKRMELMLAQFQDRRADEIDFGMTKAIIEGGQLISWLNILLPTFKHFSTIHRSNRHIQESQLDYMINQLAGMTKPRAKELRASLLDKYQVAEDRDLDDKEKELFRRYLRMSVQKGQTLMLVKLGMQKRAPIHVLFGYPTPDNTDHEWVWTDMVRRPLPDGSFQNVPLVVKELRRKA